MSGSEPKEPVQKGGILEWCRMILNRVETMLTRMGKGDQLKQDGERHGSEKFRKNLESCLQRNLSNMEKNYARMLNERETKTFTMTSFILIE